MMIGTRVTVTEVPREPTPIVRRIQLSLLASDGALKTVLIDAPLADIKTANIRLRYREGNKLETSEFHFDEHGALVTGD